MKPRTKFEKKIAGLMNSLPPLKKEVIRWAYNDSITPVGFTTNGKECYCGHCGKIFKPTAKIQTKINRIAAGRRRPCSICSKSTCYYLTAESKRECKEYNRNKNQDKTETVCNHCRKKLSLHISRRRKDVHWAYIAVIMPIDGIQTQRNVKLEFEFRKGFPVKTTQHENFDVWLSEKGVIRITRVKFGEKEVNENGNKLMSLQADTYTTFISFCHSSHLDKFIVPDKIFPKIKLADYLAIRGKENLSAQFLEKLKHLDNGIFDKNPNSFEFMRALIKFLFVETLLKQGDFDTLNVFFSYPLKTIETILPAFYIARRHNYKPEDLNLWIDMVMLYHQALKDIHNPQFICPENLQAAHQEALDIYEKYSAREERRRREEYERTRPRDIFWYLDHHQEEFKLIGEKPGRFEELNEIYGGLDPRCRYWIEEYVIEDTGELKYRLISEFLQYYERTDDKSGKLNEHFIKLKSRFFNIEFGNDELEIVSLDSIEEYRKEGEIMHNCIETNSYFLKPDTLILSVRKEGKPVADVEISLRTFKVVQCYGPCNWYTPYQTQIEELISKNIDIIKSRM